MKYEKGHAKIEGSGRAKGTKNRIAGKTVEEVLAGNQTPMEFLLSIMHDQGNELVMRVDAAKAVSPYVHPRLANIDVNGSLNATVVVVHDWRGKKARASDEG